MNSVRNIQTKRSKIRFFGMTTLAALGLALVLAAPAMTAEVSVNTLAAGSGEALYIYEMEQPQLTADEALAKLDGVLAASGAGPLAQAEYTAIEDRFTFSGERYQVSVSRDGSELYFSDWPGLKLAEPTGSLPTDGEALKMARRFLNEAGLTPQDLSELQVDHIGGIMQASADPTMGYEPEKKAAVVYFYRELDGLRVMNYGSSITVTVGDAPVPVGLQYHWREVAGRDPVSRDMLIDPGTVHGLIQTDASRVYAADSHVTVDSIELVLYDNGGEFIQPAYCYRGTCLSAKGGEMPVLGYVPALVNGPEEVHHPGYSPEMPDSFRMMQQ